MDFNRVSTDILNWFCCRQHVFDSELFHFVLVEECVTINIIVIVLILI